MLGALIRAFWQPEQDDLLLPYADRFLDEVPRLAGGGMLMVFGLMFGMFPQVADEAFLERAGGMAEDPDCDPTIRAAILIGIDTLSRRERRAPPGDAGSGRTLHTSLEDRHPRRRVHDPRQHRGPRGRKNNAAYCSSLRSLPPGITSMLRSENAACTSKPGRPRTDSSTRTTPPDCRLRATGAEDGDALVVRPVVEDRLQQIDVRLRHRLEGSHAADRRDHLGVHLRCDRGGRVVTTTFA